MALYQLIYNSSNVLRTSDNAIIPNDSNNTDWKNYQSWINAGNVADPVDINVRRNGVLSALTNKRDSVIASGVTYNNNVFLTDDNSQNILHKALYMQSSGDKTDTFPRSWILADGLSITVAYTDMQAVAVLIATKTDSAYANYLTLKAQIESSTDPESIDITTGWPA